MLFPFTAILQIINFTALYILVYWLMLSSCYWIVLFYYFIFTYIFFLLDANFAA